MGRLGLVNTLASGVPWLGVQPSGRRLTMRVMDWWRRDGDLLRENWIFIDILNYLAIQGLDVLGRMQRVREY